MNKIYGYGIVDKDGNPWWAEDCVCEDRDPMDDIVGDLNYFGKTSAQHEDRIPYRVVRLYRVAKK